MFLHFQVFRLLAKARFSQNQLMGKKPSLSSDKRAQIITLSKLNFSVCQIAKKVKVSKTSTKMKAFSQTEKGQADQKLPAAEKTALCTR